MADSLRGREDDGLVRLVLGGDDAALETLLRRHERWIYNAALRVMQQREDAEDATQGCLLMIAKHLSAFRGEILSISRDDFRQRLARARRQLSSFMEDHRGLVDRRNPCRCARKTRAFIRDGVVDPRRLTFAGAHYSSVERRVALGYRTFERLVEDASAALYRRHPLYEPPDLVARVRETLAAESFRTVLDLN